MKRRIWVAGLWLVGLMGCKANDDSVAQFISHSHQQAHASVEPLEEQPTFVAESFVMTSTRSPFMQPYPEPGEVLGGQKLACWQPTVRSQRAPLERYPLAQLSMRGVIGDAEQLWALIYTPEGKLAKVREGHYIGLNQGRIKQVGRKAVEIEEVLPDGEGCWIKRASSLALVKHDSDV
ncbi:pilus assembly protein PilQ [Photobacterium sanctipauli]|uniref:Pilus assembly protein PilQ n=1 Tax=Photobacterium sanctipauli TaxID=1342794 RepID=A0A2T3NSK8_9GAMM|nr:pilus assembly protein PilP [Photobacterium sanctipauli]PSW19232.1 pilus assembly protein PilQ [Photobacterium sanctipauli]